MSSIRVRLDTPVTVPSIISLINGERRRHNVLGQHFDGRVFTRNQRKEFFGNHQPVAILAHDADCTLHNINAGKENVPRSKYSKVPFTVGQILNSL